MARKNLPAEARTLIAHVRNDITIPYFTDVLSPLDETLIARGGGKGLAIYDEIERDTHAYAVLQKRKFGLVARDWVVEPASESAADKAAAAFVEDVLTGQNFDQLCLDLLDATLKGVAVAEIVWGRAGNNLVPDRIIAHDPRRFAFDADWRPRLLTRENPMSGKELPEHKFVVHRFGVKGNNPYGLGLGSKLFWPVLFKREGVAFWATFLEKFASPTPVGKYPAGTLPADQKLLLESLLGMVQSGAVVVPIGSEVDFLEATRAGQVSYSDWCKYWDTQMALCVFGSTLATYVEGQGSRAASETHQEGEERIIDADADLLTDTLGRSLVAWLVELNCPGAAVPAVRRPRPKNESAHEDLRKKRAENAKAEIELLFSTMGRLPEAQAADIASALAGIDLLPQVPIEVLRQLAPHIAGQRDRLVAAVNGGRVFGADGALAPEVGDRVRHAAFAEAQHDHGISALAGQMADEADPLIEAMLARARDELATAVAAGESLADMRQRLLGLYEDLTVDALGNIIAQGVATAELSGRADVDDETRH